MNRVHKFNKLFILFLILFISIGFAYLTRDLTLSGISSIFRNTWDVHFDNVVVSEGSVEAETPVIDTNKTSVSFLIEFSTPGDFYEFTVDAVNGGTIDAMLNTFTSSELDESVANLLEYTVTYADGEELAQYQELNSGDTLTYKIRLYYKLDISEDDLPDSNIPVEITFTTDYIQADSNRIRRRAENTLYNVLKTEAESGGLAKKYTGAHQDSMDASKSTKDIYHWYADNDTDGTAVTNKNNVIFANHCWQMIRTTDTGGVKLLYNGEVESNQCLNTRGTHVGYASRTNQNLVSNYWYGTDYTYDSETKTFKVSGITEQTTWNATTGPGLIGKYTCKLTSEDGSCSTLYLVESYSDSSNGYVIPLNSNSNYSQFGSLQFNASYNSPSYVVYMYNTVYPKNSKTMISSEGMLSWDSLSTTYWYAHDAVWGNPTANRYNLDSPYQVSATTDYPNLVGEYTFRNATQTHTDTSVYYIAAVNNTTMYYIQLQNSTNHNLADYNYTYTYGDSYTDNGDGTYTIDSPTTVNRSDWYTSYSNVGANKYVCKNAVNDTCSELWYTTETSKTYMAYIKVADVYKYSKGFTWDGSKYVLDNDASISFWNINDTTNKTSINNAHYTCWNETGECTTISYIYSIIETYPYYINITNGKSVEDTLNEMLYDNGVNQVNSTMKSGVDAWYKHYILEDYDVYIEDTIFCNDRSIRALNGWNPDGGSINNDLLFKDFNLSIDLSCTNLTDQFSISNNNAKLTYKVGLMSSPEMNILNNSNPRKTGQNYWLASPYYFDYYSSFGRYVFTNGVMDGLRVDFAYGVRPAVSLSPNVFYTSGNGSMETPYIVDSN